MQPQTNKITIIPFIFYLLFFYLIISSHGDSGPFLCSSSFRRGTLRRVAVPGPGGRVRSTPAAAAASAASPAATPASPASPAAPLCLRVFFLLVCESSSFLSARGSCAPGGRTPRMPAPLRALLRRLHAPAGPAPAVTLRYSASLSDSAHPEFWRPVAAHARKLRPWWRLSSCGALVALRLPSRSDGARSWPRHGGHEPRWPRPGGRACVSSVKSGTRLYWGPLVPGKTRISYFFLILSQLISL